MSSISPSIDPRALVETDGEGTALLLATEGEGVVETMLLGLLAHLLVVVAAVTEGEGVRVAETPLALVAAPVQ